MYNAYEAELLHEYKGLLIRTRVITRVHLDEPEPKYFRQAL